MTIRNGNSKDENALEALTQEPELWTASPAIMRYARQPLQSHHAGIRRKA
jgi:hypothetical protein